MSWKNYALEKLCEKCVDIHVRSERVRLGTTVYPVEKTEYSIKCEIRDHLWSNYCQCPHIQKRVSYRLKNPPLGCIYRLEFFLNK